MGKFQGYYIKATDQNNSVAAIFGRNKNKKGKSAFIQIIHTDGAYNVNFDYKDFKMTKRPFSVTIGNNKIDNQGMVLDINDVGLVINANWSFTEFIPIKYDAMGFFRFFPLMECKHSVTSMDHNVTGHIQINDLEINFENAKGYIEGDRGRSFPRKYFWAQCNLFNGAGDLSIMVSCARIPYLGIRFTGTICIIHHGGKEYRLATYRRARVKAFLENKLVVKQGKKMLFVEVLDTEKNKHKLFAPNNGKMDRFIKETVITTVRYKFVIKGETIFDVTSEYSAYEYSKT